MPKTQVMDMLLANWGSGREKQFKRFAFTSLAAASIGQVHRAQTLDGRDLAIKIQYPGVRESIDSDVDNVAGLLRLSGLMPKAMDIEPLLRDAKRQLHDEANYIREGNYLHCYGDLLADAPQYRLPRLHADLTTPSVLAMDYVRSVPIETLADSAQAERDRVMTLLFSLLLREVFEFRRVQTDRNFANYRYDTHSHRLVLLDFGATRPCKARMSLDFRRLIKGAMAADRVAMSAAFMGIGYLGETTQEKHRQAVLDIAEQALEPFCQKGGYDFGSSDLPARVRANGMALGMQREFFQLPPADAMLLQRKFGGLYLLAIRLKARVNLNVLAKAAFASSQHSL